jgi:hypothetical protein
MKRSFAAALAALAACGDTSPDDQDRRKPDLPDVSAATFPAAPAIDHPFLPFPPGATWTYEAGDERIVVTVTADTRVIQGVTAAVVRDTVTIAGELKEDTHDWYAQDDAGNVWYLGEDTCAYENGQCVDREGAWEWGTDGALPGWVMPATPEVNGRRYYQEYYPGHAEDAGEVVDVDRTVTVRAGTYQGCIRTHDTSTLDPELDEYKTYCPGVGLVLIEEADVREELVEVSGLP